MKIAFKHFISFSEKLVQEGNTCRGIVRRKKKHFRECSLIQPSLHFSTQGHTSIFQHVSLEGISTPKVRYKELVSPSYHLPNHQFFLTNLDQNFYPQPPGDFSTSKFQYQGKRKK
jgi:hypothetical protein